MYDNLQLWEETQELHDQDVLLLQLIGEIHKNNINSATLVELFQHMAT